MPLKQSVSIALLVLLLYNAAGYYAFFAAFQYQAKREMKALIKSHVPEHALTVFRFASREEAHTALDWIHDREFRHDEQLYDVVRQHVDTATGAVTYYALPDHQEQHLLSQLARHARNQVDPGTQPGQHGLNWLKYFALQGYLPSAMPGLDGPMPEHLRFADPHRLTAAYVADPATPPPRPA